MVDSFPPVLMVHGLAEAGYLDLFLRQGKIIPDDFLLSILHLIHVIAALMSPIDHVPPRVEVHVLYPLELADLVLAGLHLQIDAYTGEH